MNMYRERPVLWMAAALCGLVTLMLGVYLTLQPNSEILTGAAYLNLASVFPFASVSAALRIWGVLYVAKGVAAVTGLAVQSWRIVGLVAMFGGVLWTAWAGIFFYTAVANSWLGFVGACGFLLAAGLHVFVGKASAIWLEQRG